MTTPAVRDALLAALTDPPELDADIIGLPEDQAVQLLDAYRVQVLAEAADIASEERTRLDELGEHLVARGASCAAARIRRIARTGQAPAPATDEQQVREQVAAEILAAVERHRAADPEGYTAHHYREGLRAGASIARTGQEG